MTEELKKKQKNTQTEKLKIEKVTMQDGNL